MVRQNSVANYLIIAVIATAVSCAPRTENRGNIATISQIEKLQVGKHSKDYVRGLLGTPSTEGTFDKNVWYYIGRRTEKWAFLQEKVINQNIVAIYFNSDETIQFIQTYNRDDIRKIEMAEGKTPTSGRELGIFEQILGNFGRFNRGTEANTYRY